MTEEQLKEIEARARGESPASASLKVEALCALRGGDVIALAKEVRRLWAILAKVGGALSKLESTHASAVGEIEEALASDG